MQTPINAHTVAGPRQLPKGRVMMTVLVWSGVGYYSKGHSHVSFDLSSKQKSMLSAPNVIYQIPIFMASGNRNEKMDCIQGLPHMSVGN